MLSYMKCGKTECEKPRLLEKAFCEEHAAAERETAQPLINQKIPLDECLVEYRNNGSQLFMRFEDETVLRFELAERGTTPPEGLDARIREVARNAVEIAIIRNDLEWDEDADMTAEQIAADAADALFGEGTCDDKPVPSVSRLRDAATQRAPVTSQISEFFVSGELLDGKESLWLALSTLQQLVTKWEGVAADYRKRQMFDLAQEAGSFADELKEQITHIKADYASNAPYKGTKAQRAPVEQGRRLTKQQREELVSAAHTLGDFTLETDHRAQELILLVESYMATAPDHAREGALRPALEKIIHDQPHADTCGTVISDSEVYPCSCWQKLVKRALANGKEGTL